MMGGKLAKYCVEERESKRESEMGDSAYAGKEQAKSTLLDSIGWTSLSMLDSTLGHALPSALHIKYCVQLDFILPATGATINLALRMGM